MNTRGQLAGCPGVKEKAELHCAVFFGGVCDLPMIIVQVAHIVGNTYIVQLSGGTATQVGNQFEEFINFPNTVFQILNVSTNYSANNSITKGKPLV